MEYYTELRPRRMTIEFAVQVQPLGTADAVAAAEQVVGQRPFIMINSDNYYPLQAFCGLRDAPGPAVAIFDQETLVAESNIPAERIAKFAVVEGITEADGSMRLKRIIEKPDEATLARLPRPLGVSMNCWRFGPAIFEACRRSSRRRGASWKSPTPCSMPPTAWTSVSASCGAKRPSWISPAGTYRARCPTAGGREGQFVNGTLPNLFGVKP